MSQPGYSLTPGVAMWRPWEMTLIVYGFTTQVCRYRYGLHVVVKGSALSTCHTAWFTPYVKSMAQGCPSHLKRNIKGFALQAVTMECRIT
eukprot:1157363-Pelagomonas_calceolata.AAC.9